MQKAKHLQGTFSTCRARRPPALQGSDRRCTSGVAPAPQGQGQLSWDLCCLQAKALARATLALPTRNWPFKRPATCKAPLALAGRESRLRHNAATGAARLGMLRPPGTRPAPLGLAVHPGEGACTCRACLTHQKLTFHKAGNLQGTFSTCRPHQSPAPQGNEQRCTLAQAPASQGPDQHPWDLRCIQRRRLHVRRLPYPPETGLAQGRPLARHL